MSNSSYWSVSKQTPIVLGSLKFKNLPFIFHKGFKSSTNHCGKSMKIHMKTIHIPNKSLVGFVWTCWVNLPNDIAIFHRDNDQQNQTGFRGTNHFQTHPVFHPFSPAILTGRWPPSAGRAADGGALGGAVAAAGAQGVTSAAADDDLLGRNGWLNRGS